MSDLDDKELKDGGANQQLQVKGEAPDLDVPEDTLSSAFFKGQLDAAASVSDLAAIEALRIKLNDLIARFPASQDKPSTLQEVTPFLTAVQACFPRAEAAISQANKSIAEQDSVKADEIETKIALAQSINTSIQKALQDSTFVLNKTPDILQNPAADSSVSTPASTPSASSPPSLTAKLPTSTPPAPVPTPPQAARPATAGAGVSKAASANPSSSPATTQQKPAPVHPNSSLNTPSRGANGIDVYAEVLAIYDQLEGLGQPIPKVDLPAGGIDETGRSYPLKNFQNEFVSVDRNPADNQVTLTFPASRDARRATLGPIAGILNSAGPVTLEGTDAKALTEMIEDLNEFGIRFTLSKQAEQSLKDFKETLSASKESPPMVPSPSTSTVPPSGSNPPAAPSAPVVPPPISPAAPVTSSTSGVPSATPSQNKLAERKQESQQSALAKPVIPQASSIAPTVQNPPITPMLNAQSSSQGKPSLRELADLNNPVGQKKNPAVPSSPKRRGSI